MTLVYTVPHGDILSAEDEYKPSAATVAEYEGYSRDYLLFRIEELEGDLEGVSKDAARAYAACGRIREAMRTFLDMTESDKRCRVITEEDLAEEIAEAIAEAKPKKKRPSKDWRVLAEELAGLINEVRAARSLYAGAPVTDDWFARADELVGKSDRLLLTMGAAS
jgi:predicted RNA-binding Zn ribbon-like protein